MGAKIKGMVELLEVLQVQDNEDDAREAAIFKIQPPTQNNRPFSGGARDERRGNHRLWCCGCCGHLPFKIVAVGDIDARNRVERTVNEIPSDIGHMYNSHFRHAINPVSYTHLRAHET